MSNQPDSTPQTRAEAPDKGVVCDALARRELPWDYDDVVRVLKHVAESSPWAEDCHSSDYCMHCGRHVGNARLEYERGTREADMHRRECVYVLARDMLTNIA